MKARPAKFIRLYKKSSTSFKDVMPLKLLKKLPPR